MACPLPSPPPPPAAGGTYEAGEDGSLQLTQQTAEPTAEPDPESPAAEDQDDAAAY